MDSNPLQEPIQLRSDCLNVFEDVAIDFTGLPPEAYSDDPNQTETESFGSVGLPKPFDVAIPAVHSSPAESV
jgi:hypothetical protein